MEEEREGIRKEGRKDERKMKGGREGGGTVNLVPFFCSSIDSSPPFAFLRFVLPVILFLSVSLSLSLSLF